MSISKVHTVLRILLVEAETVVSRIGHKTSGDPALVNRSPWAMKEELNKIAQTLASGLDNITTGMAALGKLEGEVDAAAEAEKRRKAQAAEAVTLGEMKSKLKDSIAKAVGG